MKALAWLLAFPFCSLSVAADDPCQALSSAVACNSPLLAPQINACDLSLKEHFEKTKDMWKQGTLTLTSGAWANKNATAQMSGTSNNALKSETATLRAAQNKEWASQWFQKCHNNTEGMSHHLNVACALAQSCPQTRPLWKFVDLDSCQAKNPAVDRQSLLAENPSPAAVTALSNGCLSDQRDSEQSARQDRVNASSLGLLKRAGTDSRSAKEENNPYLKKILIQSGVGLTASAGHMIWQHHKKSQRLRKPARLDPNALWEPTSVL